MENISISEAARRAGVRASAIRYYERVGILPLALRVRGQRRYDLKVVYRLAVLRKAQAAGFTLSEIRDLFLGFRPTTPVSSRWKKLARQKLVDLEAEMVRLRSMKELLSSMQTNCRCRTVDECGAAIVNCATTPDPEHSC